MSSYVRIVLAGIGITIHAAALDRFSKMVGEMVGGSHMPACVCHIVILSMGIFPVVDDKLLFLWGLYSNALCNVLKCVEAECICFPHSPSHIIIYVKASVRQAKTLQLTLHVNFEFSPNLATQMHRA